jgi:hypothetical protein
MPISADLVESQLENIQKASEGNVEALEELRKEINKDFILKLNISETSKADLITMLDELAAMAADKDIGATLTLDNTDSIAALNEALITGAATLDEIQAMFANADLTLPEAHTGTKTITTTTRSVTSARTKGADGQWGDYVETESITTNKQDVPYVYFGD